MRKVTIGLVVLGVLALALISMPMRAQNQGLPFPPEMSPLRTFRIPPAQPSLVPSTKFVKVKNAIPNKYIVVLNDDVVSSSAPVNVRRAQITGIANGLAQVHGGKRGFVYETALKGFSVELPNEAAAIALSQNAQVRWVEEDGTAQLGSVCQSNPPWGLDRVDQIGRLPACGPNGIQPCGIDTTSTSSTYGNSIYPGASYCYANTGAGVNVYVIDLGINADHVDFLDQFSNHRAHRTADCSSVSSGNAADCSVYAGEPSSGNDSQIDQYGNILSHGTWVAGIVGGTTYGVAKGVKIRSVRVSVTDTAHDYNHLNTEISSIVAAVNWVTADYQANHSVPAVTNLSSYCTPGPFPDRNPDQS